MPMVSSYNFFPGVLSSVPLWYVHNMVIAVASEPPPSHKAAEVQPCDQNTVAVSILMGTVAAKKATLFWYVAKE